MDNIYYKIWIDGITKLRSRPQNKGMWKFYGMIFTSMAMAFNLALIIAILERNVFKDSSYDIKIKIFNEPRLDGAMSFFILFLLPPLILNYLLIFHNNRYEKFMGRYKTYDGKLYAGYLLISFFLPFLLIFIGALFL